MNLLLLMKKKKYKFASPSKSLILEWTLQALSEIDANLVTKSKYFYQLLLYSLGFKIAGITDQSKRDNIMNNKLKDLCVVYDVEEYVNIEKDKICMIKPSNDSIE